MKNTNLLKRIVRILNNKGTTLVEMIVCFILIGIFMTAATSIILLITNNYFMTTGETNAKQVMDIVMGKVSSEIEGSKYRDKDVVNNFAIDGDSTKISGNTATMYDKTDTRVRIGVNSSGYLEIYYYPIEDDDESVARKATIWKYSDKMYDGFTISDFEIIKANKLNEYKNIDLNHEKKLQNYGVNSTSGYGDNVVVVLMTLNSGRYGDYKTCRFIRMYNAPENQADSINP